MTVKDLRKLLTRHIDLEDETKVLMRMSDHGLRSATAVVTTVLDEGHGNYTEDYGEAVTPEVHYGKRIKALVVD